MCIFMVQIFWLGCDLTLDIMATSSSLKTNNYLLSLVVTQDQKYRIPGESQILIVVC